MIFIDGRMGSKETFPLFPQGIAQITQLEFGDFAFSGLGKDDSIFSLGIERKVANDLLESLKSHRINEQLLGMRQNYDVSFLLVESQFRKNAETGYLEYFNQYSKWQETQFRQESVWGFLNEVALVAGVHIFQTRNMIESVDWITELHSFVNKPWESHRSCYAPHIDLDPEFRKGREKISLLRRFAVQLNGVGHNKAQAVEIVAGNIERLMSMSENDFDCIPGIGNILSKSIWNELHKKEN